MYYLVIVSFGPLQALTKWTEHTISTHLRHALLPKLFFFFFLNSKT